MIINNISISTNGSNKPLATWEKNKIVRMGTFGIIIMITAIIMSPIKDHEIPIYLKNIKKYLINTLILHP